MEPIDFIETMLGEAGIEACRQAAEAIYEQATRGHRCAACKADGFCDTTEGARQDADQAAIDHAEALIERRLAETIADEEVRDAVRGLMQHAADGFSAWSDFASTVTEGLGSDEGDF